MDRIENYELGRLVEQTPYSRTYKAVCLRGRNKGRVVTIIVISTTKPNLNEERYREVVSLKKTLHHPGILSLYSAFDTCQVVEYAPYGCLAQFPALSEAHLRQILPMIVDALDYIHRRGYVHLGLRPKHVYVTEGFRVKIWGLDSVRKIQCPARTGSRTQRLHQQEEELYSPGSDVWYLGCLCISLLAPASGDVTSWKALLPESTSAALVDLLDHLLQSEPKQRMSISNIHSHPFFAPQLPTASLEDLYSCFQTYQLSPMLNRQHVRARDLSFPERQSGIGGSETIKSPSHTMPLGSQFPCSGVQFAETVQETQAAHRPQTRQPPSPPRAVSTAALNSNRPQNSVSSIWFTPSPSIRYPLVVAGLLPPQTLTTSHAIIKILPSGEIMIDLRDGYRSKGRKGESILLVSPDGLNVSLFHAARITADSDLKDPVWTYSIVDFPMRYRTAYSSVARYIDLVKRRTPMLTVSKGQLRFSLMSNLPQPDIELVSSDKQAPVNISSRAARLRLSGTDGTLEIAKYHIVPAKSDHNYMSLVGSRRNAPCHTGHVGEWKKRILPLLRDGTIDMDIVESEDRELVTELKDFIGFVTSIWPILDQSQLLRPVLKTSPQGEASIHRIGDMTSLKGKPDLSEHETTRKGLPPKRDIKLPRLKPHLSGLGLPPRPRRFSVNVTVVEETGVDSRP